MGGAIAQLIARDHPDVVKAVVLCATALQWRYPRWVRFAWKLMSLLQFILRVFPSQVYAWMTEGVAIDNPALAHWVAAELHRGSAHDIAEAGRELSKFDSRRWINGIGRPVAVVLTTEDHLVPPRSQLEIASYARDAKVFQLPANHVSAFAAPSMFTSVLLEAIHSAEERSSAVAAAVGEVVSLPRQSLPVERGA